MKNLILLISFIVFGITTQANTWVVDSLQSSGFGTLRAAVDSASNGDTIRFNPNLIANGSDSISLLSEIAFSKALTFKGLYTQTDTLFISGRNANRIFNISNVSKIALDSVVIVNGFTSVSGAGIQTIMVDSLMLFNSKISECSALLLGGGVYMDPTDILGIESTAYLNLTNSVISNNAAVYRGGGLCITPYWQNSHLHQGLDMVQIHISGSLILNNTSNNYGGGLHVFCADTMIITMDSSIISGNKSYYGGGVYCNLFSNITSSGHTEILILNSEFNNNEATHKGGAIAVKMTGGSLVNYGNLNSEVIIKNTTFYGNGGPSMGGTIDINLGHYINHSFPGSLNADLLFENSTIAFSNGTAIKSEIGGNSNGHISNTYTSNVKVKNSTIYKSNSLYGSAISNYVGSRANRQGVWSAVTRIENSSIVKNTSSLIPAIWNSYGYSTGTSEIYVKSSIIAFNGDTSMINPQSPLFYSGGNNIFSDSSLIGTVSTDQINVDSTMLNLSSLSFNGGSTPTLVPIFPSVAINNGNPLDSSDAQNIAIVGIREVGAAEVCVRTFRTDTVVAYDSYTWVNGITYAASDTIATHIVGNVAGCDSVASLNLTILTSCRETDTISTCNSYTWRNGVTYYTSNYTAQHIVGFPNGCDSIYSLQLTIANTMIETFETCDSITWRNGITYSQSNFSARDTISISASCDSIYILNLTVHSPEYTSDTIVSCDSLTWVNGVTYYSSSNSISDTFNNRHGCDSTVALNLTINPSTHVTENISACSTYTWSNGQIYVLDNNTDTQNFIKTNGCDSVIHLDLSIHSGTFATDIHVACDSLAWIDGNTYYSNNTTAIHTLIGGNSNGCDSVVTLDLAILNTSIGIDVITACDSYMWNGITYTSNNNTALDTLANVAGCDSIITLNLTILNSSSFTDVITSCTEMIWIDGITYNQTTSGQTFTIPNTNGCDSVVTLDFTLLEVDTTVTRNYLTLSAQATSATYQWIDCVNGAINGETNANFRATVNGDYQVEVTQNGCIDTSACFTINNVGIQETELIGISLYPNPTSDVLNIDKGSNTTLEITITNSAGAVVHQSTTQNQITTINMAQMAAGMYVVALKNELGVKVERVVKR
jgi:hypothetical protein